VLATQTARDFGGQTTQGLTSSVDDNQSRFTVSGLAVKVFILYSLRGRPDK
jgi:hypothetical protein